MVYTHNVAISYRQHDDPHGIAGGFPVFPIWFGWVFPQEAQMGHSSLHDDHRNLVEPRQGQYGSMVQDFDDFRLHGIFQWDSNSWIFWRILSGFYRDL